MKNKLIEGLVQFTVEVLIGLTVILYVGLSFKILGFVYE